MSSNLRTEQNENKGPVPNVDAVTSTIYVYPGKMQEYKVRVRLREVIKTLDKKDITQVDLSNIQIVEIKCKSPGVECQTIPGTNTYTTIDGTQYFPEIQDKNPPPNGQQPMKEYYLDNHLENPVKFAVWAPGISEYKLSMTGDAVHEKKGTAPGVVAVTTIKVKHADKISLLDTPCNDVLYSLNPNDNLGIGYPGVQNNGCKTEYSVQRQPVNAYYGFFQVIRSITQRVDKTTEPQAALLYPTNAATLLPQADCIEDGAKKICINLDSSLVPQQNRNFIAAGKSKSIGDWDAPWIRAWPRFDTDQACTAHPQSFHVADKYTRNMDFSNYLMIKIGDLTDPDSFWVPVRKADWSYKSAAECATAKSGGGPCGIGGIDKDGPPHVSIPYANEWVLLGDGKTCNANPQESCTVSPKDDGVWLNSPLPPTWISVATDDPQDWASGTILDPNNAAADNYNYWCPHS